MRRFFLTIMTYVMLAGYLPGGTLKAQDMNYAKVPADPAHIPLPEEKRGEVIKCSFSSSAIYPGTKRDYWIYVPKAYTPDKPACLFVCLDGLGFNAPTVFDNLIAKGDMPVTIGVFVASGVIYNADNEAILYTRQYEYDTTDDTFVRFLKEELFPEVERQTASDGRAIRLSKDGNDAAIAGCSSGGICAFNAAWQRPDVFSRVLSCCGSFAGLHGGNELHILVRKTEPKPIRIFLDAGKLDQALPPIGDLFEANLAMESALRFAGYEVDHAWHVSGHDATHATQAFPDLMRWLWKGWPERIPCGSSKNRTLETVLDSIATWETVELPVVPQSDLLSNAQGDVFFSDGNGSVYKMAKGRGLTVLCQLSPGEKLLACSEQKLYTADEKGTVFVRDGRKKQALAGNLPGTEGIRVSAKGKVYVAQRLPGGERVIWSLDGKGKKTLEDKRLHGGVQMAFSADEQMLACSEEHSHWVCMYTADENGKLSNGTRFCWLHNTDNSDFRRKGRMSFDTEGRLYVATGVGVQISENRGVVAGLVTGILSLPSGEISTLCFGGENRDELFVVSGHTLYRRKMNVQGAM